jgi:hypothetical protein
MSKYNSGMVISKNLQITEIELEKINSSTNNNNLNVEKENNFDLNFSLVTDTSRIFDLEKNKDNSLIEKSQFGSVINDFKEDLQNDFNSEKKNPSIQEINLKRNISYGNCTPYFFVNGVPLILIGPGSIIILLILIILFCLNIK